MNKYIMPTIKKKLHKTRKIFKGGGKTPKKKSRAKPEKKTTTKPSAKPKKTHEIIKPSLVTGQYFRNNVEYHIDRQISDNIFLMRKPNNINEQILPYEHNKDTNEIKEELVKYDLINPTITTKIFYGPTKNTNETQGLGYDSLDANSHYFPIINAIINYMKGDKVAITFQEGQRQTIFEDYFDDEMANPTIKANFGSRIHNPINLLKRHRQIVENAEAYAHDNTSSSMPYPDGYSEWISNIHDFLSIIIQPTKKRSGNIYWFKANIQNHSNIVWGMIYIENMSNIMGTEFRRDNSFDTVRDTIGFNITEHKTYSINNNPQLFSIVVRLLLCCDKVHDLKGRNSPLVIKKIVEKLRDIISRLHNGFQSITRSSLPVPAIYFYDFSEEIFNMWKANTAGTSILTNIESSLLQFFLKLMHSLNNLATNIADENIKDGIEYIIDNAMGRETAINNRFGNPSRVISASTLFDGGCKLSEKSIRYRLLGEEHGSGMGKIHPYTIDFGNWKFSRNKFYHMTYENKKRNNNKSGLFVSVDSRPLTTDLHFCLDRKYKAKLIAIDESEVLFNNIPLKVPDKPELFDSLVQVTDSINIKEGVISHTIEGGTDPKDNFFNTKALCDDGQVCELFGFDFEEGRKYATVHNDVPAAIFQIILQHILYEEGVGFFEQPTLASATTKAFLGNVSLNTPKKEINCIKGNVSCNIKTIILEENALVEFGIQDGGSSSMTNDIKDEIKKLYNVYEYSSLFDFSEVTSSEFFYKINKKYSKNIMNEDLEKRSLVYYILKSSNLNILNAFLEIINEKDREEFILFVNYNTILTYRTCEHLEVDILYPGTKKAIRNFSIEQLLQDINKMFDYKEIDKVNEMIQIYYPTINISPAQSSLPVDVASSGATSRESSGASSRESSGASSASNYGASSVSNYGANSVSNHGASTKFK